MNKGTVLKQSLLYDLFFLSFVFLFTVFAAIDSFIRISQYKYVIQFLLDGSDTARIFTFYHVGDLFWQGQASFFYDLIIFDDVDGDIVIDKTKYI